MPLRLSATEDDDCRHIGKIGTVQRATTRRWVDKQVTSLAAGGRVHGFISANAPYRECKNLRQGDLAWRYVGSDGFGSDRRTSVKADASDLTVALR